MDTNPKLKERIYFQISTKPIKPTFSFQVNETEDKMKANFGLRF